MADDRTYIRVHDGMDDHPKVVGLSDGAFRLLMRSWSYCSRQLTDGQLPDAAWRDRGTPKARRELVDAGLAHLPGGECPHPGCPTPPPKHVQMHDYLEHQRSAAEVAALKQARAEAGRKGGKSRASAQASAKQVLGQTASKTVASTETEADTELRTSFEGGSHVSSGSPAKPPLYADRCTRHGDDAEPGNCGNCADVRKARQATSHLSLVTDEFERPAWCGDCDQWTRLIEVEIDGRDAMTQCPTCHPLAVAS